jgi:hypothetical protein
MKCLKRISLLLVITTLLFSCKKSNDAPPPKDYAASIKDKNWWGTLAYTGKTPEYYSVAFKADNSLMWSQRTSDTQGLWALNGDTITITFTGNTVQIKATISDDNKFTNIQDNTAASEITSGQLITTPNLYLDNTSWKGTIPASSQTLQLYFSSPLTVKIGADNGTPFGPYNYTRVAGGSTVRFSSAAFGGAVLGIIVSNTEMKGTMAFGATTNYQWSATLQ